MEKQFIPIGAKTIIPNVELLFDIYIKIQDRYIHYIHSGDDINDVRLQKLQDRNLKQFFILADDEVKYQAFLDRALANAITGDTLSPEQRVNAIIDISISSIEDLYNAPENQRTYAIFQKAAFGIISTIGKSTSLLSCFYEAIDKSVAAPIYCHALSTASIACCMSEHLEMSENDQNMICQSAMLLHICKTQMDEKDQTLFEKEYNSLSDTQLKIYRTHAATSATILEDKSHFPKEVVNLVKHHEERKDGSGPLGKQDLTKSEELIGICSTFDQIKTLQNRSPKEAVDIIREKFNDKFAPEVIDSLTNVLHQQGISLA